MYLSTNRHIILHGGVMRGCLTLTESEEQSIRSYIPPNGAVKGIADFYFIFSDSTRLKILSVLAVTELCVCDVCILLGLNQTTVSHQLKLLRDARIVADGQNRLLSHRQPLRQRSNDDGGQQSQHVQRKVRLIIVSTAKV